MLRQDFAMALGQADQLGNTLLQNRVMKQQQANRVEDNAMRERMFNEQQTTRKEAAKANNDWRTQNEDQQQLQTIIKANAEGSLDDAGREKANQWIATHPKLGGTGIQLVKPQPKQAGKFNTAPGYNLEILTQLREQVTQATTPEDKAQASQRLNDFMSLTGKEAKPSKPEIDPRLSAAKKAAIDAELSGDAGAMERAQKIINQVTPKETVPVMGDVRKRDEELMGGMTSNVSPTKVADYNTELKLANEAITAKVPFEKVAARFKARTGKDFPKP